MNGELYLNNELLRDCITDIIEMAEGARNEPSGEFRDGKLLAYNEVLSALKTYLAPIDPKSFGLDFDVDRRFA